MNDALLLLGAVITELEDGRGVLAVAGRSLTQDSWLVSGCLLKVLLQRSAPAAAAAATGSVAVCDDSAEVDASELRAERAKGVEASQEEAAARQSLP